MNVVKTVVPGNSETMNQVNRQGKDSSSKRGGSGFSETLGSLDKAGSSTQSASTAPAASGGGQQAETASADEAPASANQGQNEAGKVIAAAKFFLDAKAAVPAEEPIDGMGMSGPGEAKAPETGPLDAAQLFDAESDNAALPALSDLAKLVTALSKTAPSETDTTSDTDEGDPDGNAAPADGSNENIDLLSLLASTAMPVNPAAAQNVPAQQGTSSALGTVSGAIPAENPLAGSETVNPTVVRLQKQDVPAVDLHIATHEDGSAKLDVSTASGDATDVVQVVESRRFIGLASTSNTAAITSAMATDPDWATAMSGQATNSPLISSTGQVVHVLKIQMTPVDLGHVTAAMKLVGDELSVQLTAHTLKGYSELQKDSSGILDALKAQGFTVDQVTVTLASNTERQDSNTNNRQPAEFAQQGAQQGQRGHEEKPQEQFYRQPRTRAGEEAISHESTSQSEAPARGSSSRPDHVYL